MPALAPTTGVGSRPHRVTFQNPDPTFVSDNDAGFTQAWMNLSPATMYVRIRTATPNDLERIAAGTVTTTVTHIIEMPYHSQVTTATRIVYGTRSFNVVGVANPEERNVSLILLAVELEGAPAIVDHGWIEDSWV
jgi:SPP1 family predicted phage head-tail adaptor